jgi:hypothetical protein
MVSMKCPILERIDLHETQLLRDELVRETKGNIPIHPFWLFVDMSKIVILHDFEQHL